MLHQLLSTLKQELSLPKCLQIVGYLRRMEVFSELELKLKFLQARGHWLDCCLKYIPQDDCMFVFVNNNWSKCRIILAAHHLSKTIEITRVNLFNIITQYRAIFNDDESFLRQEVNENMIFFTWVNDKVRGLSNSFLFRCNTLTDFRISFYTRRRFTVNAFSWISLGSVHVFWTVVQ